jgi:hypothetical protein
MVFKGAGIRGARAWHVRSPVNHMLSEKAQITFSATSRPWSAQKRDSPPYCLNLRSREALVTTETELKAIAPAATTGFRSTWING